MTGVRATLHRDRHRLIPALVALLITYGYFIGPPAWNQNSRLALTSALVDAQTPRIDAHHLTTGDKSWREGHFYSDKAPGASLLALPSYAALAGLRGLVGGEAPAAEPVTLPGELDLSPEAIPRLIYNRAYRLALYLCRLLSTSILAVAGVAALYLVALRRLDGDRRAAFGLALIYGLATPAMVYATALYGHPAAASFLILALAALLYARGRRHYLAAGTCLGWAVLCEYTAAIPVGILLLGLVGLLRLGLLAHRPQGGLAGWRALGWTIAGGLPWAGVLAAYHWAAFGGPLKTGYDFVYLEHFASGMAVRYGIAAPDPEALYALLFSSYRGLFYLAPVLLLAPWGLVADLWDRRIACRWLAGIALAIVAYFLLLNAGYYMWDGGAAFGPRHCVPMLPFLALGLARPLRECPRLVAILAIVSASQMVLGAAGTPEAPEHGNPLWDHAWPRLRDAQPAEVGASNLGLLLGLPGPWSLIPLVLLWLSVYFGRDHEREPDASA